MNHQRGPDFDNDRNVFDDVAAYTRELVGAHAIVEMNYGDDGRGGVLDVEPINPHARRITVTAEQFLIVTVGDRGGRWELSYTDESSRLARRIIAAVVAGNVEEREAFSRSRVVVTLEDGEIVHETGYSGCVSLLVPQPGWKRWGRLTRYQSYRPSSADDGAM